MWTVQRWVGTSSQTAASACSSPVAPSTIRNSGWRSPRLTRSSRTARQASAGLAAHVLDREQHLLAVLAHAEHDQQRRSRWPCGRADPHHRAVEDQADDRFLGERAGVPGIPVGLHLSPHPAHRILADRAAKHRRERPAHPTRVGAGQIGAGNQRIGGLRAPLVSPQRLALPLRRLAVRGVEPGARHRDLDRAKGAQSATAIGAVPVAGNDRTCFIAGHLGLRP